jgi:hypothetical protein
MGGWSNSIFSSLLEFINELLPTEGTLPKNTYEVKKYLRDLGLGYEKIPACRNDCMLFWMDIDKLNNCTVCGKMKLMKKRGRLEYRKEGRLRCCGFC